MRRIFLILPLLGVWGTWSWAGLQDQLASESQRREKMVQPLVQALAQGEKLVKQGEIMRACQQLEAVWAETPESIRNTSTGNEIRMKMASWESRLAEQEARQGRWPVARDRVLQALSYDPDNPEARKLFGEIQENLSRGAAPGEAVNPALTTKFYERLQGVKNGLKDADQLRETGQLDLAEVRYEEVLKLDPFNRVATEGIQKIYKERALVSSQVRDLSALERRREVREAWNNIYPKKSGAQQGAQVVGPLTASPTFQLEQKLKGIVIPQVDFSGADLETIRRALLALSRQYDTDPAKTGVNFVVSADVVNAQPVNLQLKDVSLGEVVRYVGQIAGVKSRLSEVGVTFSPLIETRPDLIPREFTVSPSFFKAEGSEPAPSKRAGNEPAGESTSSGLNEQDKLKELGVKFPPGAFAVYNRNTSRLRVVNNAEMLDLIGQLIGAAEEQTLLIQVGVRLVEINQSDLDSVTINSTLGGSGVNLLSSVPVGLQTNNSGSTPSASTQQGVTAQLNQIQGVGLLPNNTLQSFLQNGVLAGTNQASAYALNTLELGGTILNGMQFRTLITAISQKSSANVLANPSIVLKRGQEGSIEVTQEFRYVKEYNDPQSSIRTIIPPGTGGTFNTGVPGPETVISSFPSQISDAVPIGVKMGIKPDVTGDNTRVLMEIKPSFVDFEGFINYGAVVNSAYAAAYFSNAVTILTNNIQQPVFVRRDLTLPAVEVSDGYTLMLGGLLREDIQKIDEKVPLIGDLPLVGRAFQGKTEQAIKKNTLIFVTPRILQVDGQPLNPTAGAATTASAISSP